MVTINEQFGIFPDRIPCRLEGWTYGPLNAYAYPGDCSTDTWRIESTCGQVLIRVLASVAGSRVDQSDGLPVFYYD
jgi:hypothetical protein